MGKNPDAVPLRLGQVMSLIRQSVAELQSKVVIVLADVETLIRGHPPRLINTVWASKEVMFSENGHLDNVT